MAASHAVGDPTCGHPDFFDRAVHLTQAGPFTLSVLGQNLFPREEVDVVVVKRVSCPGAGGPARGEGKADCTERPDVETKAGEGVLPGFLAPICP